MHYEITVTIGDFQVVGQLNIEVQLADDRDQIDTTTIDYHHQMFSVVFSLWDHVVEDYTTICYKDMLIVDRHPKIKEAIAEQVKIEEELILKQYLEGVE